MGSRLRHNCGVLPPARVTAPVAYTMPEAARIQDNVEHTSALGGLVLGAAAGLLIGAALLAGPVLLAGAGIAAAGAALCTGGAIFGMLGMVSLGGMIGEALGRLSVCKSAYPILEPCSGNVFINGRKAARAIMDKVAPHNMFLSSHPNMPIAQGSAKVFINFLPAARKGDNTTCGAPIISGSGDVFIGGGQYDWLKVNGEVPSWLHWGMMGLGLISGLGLVRIGVMSGAALVRGLAGGLGGSWLGGKLGSYFGPDGEIIGGVFGGLGGGWLGAKGGLAPRTGAPGTYTPSRELPTDKWGVPTPDTDVPHTQLGRSKAKYGSEPQAREWDYGTNGNLQPKRDIDFSDHGYPDVHPNPHQHTLTPNNPELAPKGGYQRGDPKPL